MPLYWLLCFISSYLFSQCIGLKMLGPGEIIYKTFEACESAPTDIFLWVTQRKFNRTANVVDIEVRSPWPIDYNIILQLDADVKKEGGYKPGQFNIKDTVCEVLKKLLGDIFDVFLQAVGTEDCPIPEGTYKIKDFLVDQSKLTANLIYGEYRVTGQFLREGQVKGCFRVFLEIVPKDNNR